MTSSSSTHASLDASDSPAGAVASALEGGPLLAHPFYRRWEAGALAEGELGRLCRPVPPLRGGAAGGAHCGGDGCRPRARPRRPSWWRRTWPTSSAAPSPTWPCSTDSPHGWAAWPRRPARRRGAGRHLPRAGGRRTGGGAGRTGRVRDPGGGHRLDQGRGPAALVRDRRRRHGVLGRPRRHGRGARRVGRRRPRTAGPTRRGRRGRPSGRRGLVGAPRRARGRGAGLSRARCPPPRRTTPSRPGSRPGCG